MTAPELFQEVMQGWTSRLRDRNMSDAERTACINVLRTLLCASIDSKKPYRGKYKIFLPVILYNAKRDW